MFKIMFFISLQNDYLPLLFAIRLCHVTCGSFFALLNLVMDM